MGTDGTGGRAKLVGHWPGVSNEERWAMEEFNREHGIDSYDGYRALASEAARMEGVARACRAFDAAALDRAAAKMTQGPAPARGPRPGAGGRWVEERGHWHTVFEEVMVPKVETREVEFAKCTVCGGTFDSDEGIDNHIWSTYKSESHPNGASAINVSYTTSEDQGHWESQATGQTWVVDVPAHWE